MIALRLIALLLSLWSASAFVPHQSRCNVRGRALAAADPPLPNFCADCGEASMKLKIPHGDERLRAVCDACGRIEYSNPKVVVSCVVWTDDDRCLLGKRAIEPRKGTWGIPQGFMEHGETTREAAAREVLEETGAIITDLSLRAVYNVPGSVQLLYEATVSGEAVQQQIARSTHESSEVTLFPLDAIPYDELCFPTVRWALEHCIALQKEGATRVQQRTKFYNAELDQWSEFEDEAPV
jgi:ADP-ribose pyrophosphatase YjhB (NUDIX family)